MAIARLRASNLPGRVPHPQKNLKQTCLAEFAAGHALVGGPWELISGGRFDGWHTLVVGIDTRSGLYSALLSA